MVDANVTKYLDIAIFAFGSEHIVRMIGKGEYIPYVRLGCLVAVLVLAFVDITKATGIVKAYSSF